LLIFLLLSKFEVILCLLSSETETTEEQLFELIAVHDHLNCNKELNQQFVNKKKQFLQMRRRICLLGPLPLLKYLFFLEVNLLPSNSKSPNKIYQFIY